MPRHSGGAFVGHQRHAGESAPVTGSGSAVSTRGASNNIGTAAVTAMHFALSFLASGLTCMHVAVVPHLVRVRLG